MAKNIKSAKIQRLFYLLKTNEVPKGTGLLVDRRGKYVEAVAKFLGKEPKIVEIHHSTSHET